jgi:biofilm PGA synthesis protein PgaD
MDKSGPRHTALKSPLIERPDLQTRGQRTLYGGLTLAFWAFWFYLWVPVLAFLAWVLGVQQAYKYMVVLGGYHELIRVAALYGVVILLLGGGLLIWAVYNIIRFRGVEKRTEALPVTPAEIGQHFGQDPASVARWQSEQRLYVTHDESGRIARVEALVGGAAVPI